MTSQPLPSGTVTFLFSDIEGSTRLVQQLGDAYPTLLAEHRRLLRAAFAGHGGHEIGTEGDSFFVAFDRAKNAVAAVVAAQRSLAAHEWPDGVRVSVRMGLHSGDPIVLAEADSEGYTGIGVHRAARISAAGHGGQVLLSNATRELVREGLPPGVSLRDLGEVQLKDMQGRERIHQLVIEGLPSNFPPLKVQQRPAHRRPRVLAAAAVGLLALAATAIVAFGGGDSGSGPIVRANSVAAIDPGSNRVVDQIPVGVSPGALAYGSGSLWVANDDDQTISRIDVKKHRVVHSVHVPEVPSSLAAAGGAIWVASAEPGRQAISVRRIDPQFNSVGDSTEIGNVVPGNGVSAAAHGGRLWVAPQDGLVTQVDTSSARPVKEIDAKASPTAIAISDDALWIGGGGANTVTRVDPTGLITPISVGRAPTAVAVGAGAVWVALFGDNAVAKIDPATNAVKTTVAVARPEDVVVAAGSVWVTSGQTGTVTRINPSSGKVVATIRTGGSPGAITFADGRIWVSVDEHVAPPSTPVAGTLRMAVAADYGVHDPALTFNKVGWQLLQATCVKLVSYPSVAGGSGAQVQPEAATSLPAVSRGGKTYTFTVREGFKFSPPSNQPVTAETFRYTIERSASPKMHGPSVSYVNDIVGMREYIAGKAKHVSGVEVRGNKLVVRLIAPAPDIVVRLALPFFCAVPIGTPPDPKGVAGIPMAGPYYFKRAQPPEFLLARNPNYQGSRPRRFQNIALSYDVPKKRADARIKAGTLDYIPDGVAPEEFEAIKARYGEPKAKSGPRMFTSAILGTDYIFLNPTRPLFAEARMRRAVSFAVNRTALAQIGSPGQPIPERPTDQMLPPGMPGYRDADIYPVTPDVDAARKLVGPHHRRATLYVCNEPVCDQQAQVITTALAAIDIEVDVKKFGVNQLFERVGRPKEPYDMFVLGWSADYPDPDNFLNSVLLEGAGFEPPFADPRFVPRLEAAARLTGPRRYLAYGELDGEITRESAPWVPYGNPSNYDFFSARIGCQVSQPIYGFDLGSLCLRKGR